MNESASRFSDLVDRVANGIIEAVTNRGSMTPERRDERAWIVREMLAGLHPGDVRELMVASQAVLAHALSLDAIGGEPGTAEIRALSTVGALGRTMTRNVDTLRRLQAGRPDEPNKQPPKEDPRPTVDHAPEAAAIFQRAIEQAMSGAAAENRAAPMPPLNRQQKRRAEREFARLARRTLAGRSVTNTPAVTASG